MEPSHTFEELMLAYLPAVEGEINLAPVGFAVRRLKEVFAGRMLGNLKRADISAYIAKRKKDGIANATINRELDAFSAAINYARKRWDWDIPNPVQGMSLKEPEGRLRWITRAESEALMRVAEQEPKAVFLADFIRLALNTGCRKGELLGLEWARVDLRVDAPRIRLEGTHTKNGKRRFVPLNEDARRALLNLARFRAEHCPASPWVFSHPSGKRVLDLHTGFRTACNKVGITDFRIHDLRHTFASWLVQGGVPLLEVSKLLGHSSIEMTMRYAHLSPDNLTAAVAVLDRSRSGHAVPQERFLGVVSY